MRLWDWFALCFFVIAAAAMMILGCDEKPVGPPMPQPAGWTAGN